MNYISDREHLMKVSAARFKIEINKLSYLKDRLSLLFKRLLIVGVPIFLGTSVGLFALIFSLDPQEASSGIKPILFMSFIVSFCMTVFPALINSHLENKKRFAKTRYGTEIINQVEKFEKWLSKYNIVPAESLVPISGWDSFTLLLRDKSWDKRVNFKDIDGNSFVVENSEGFLITYLVSNVELLKGESYVNISVKTPVREGFKIPSIDPYGISVSVSRNLDILTHKVWSQDDELATAIFNVSNLIAGLESSELLEEQKSSLSWVVDEAEELSMMVLKALRNKNLISLDTEFKLLTTEGFKRLTSILLNIESEILQDSQSKVQDWLGRVTV